jgi:hypothetical protein
MLDLIIAFGSRVSESLVTLITAPSFVSSILKLQPIRFFFILTYVIQTTGYSQTHAGYNNGLCDIRCCLNQN